MAIDGADGIVILLAALAVPVMLFGSRLFRGARSHAGRAVAVATVMHIIVRFRQLQRDSLAPRDALEQALTQLAWPVVGAIATDVVGFGSLWWAQVGPVQDFGTMMMVGALTVLPAICLLIPSLALVGQRRGSSALDGDAT